MLLLQDRVQTLYSILKALGFENYKDYSSDLKKRIILQKQIFFLQEIGLKFGYLFRWYKYGPHSKELSDELDEVFLRVQLNKPLPEKDLDSDERKKLELFMKLNQELLKLPPVSISDIYEKLASFYFLYSQFPSRYKNVKHSKKEIQEAVIENLHSIKPELGITKEEGERIFLDLSKLQLITDNS